MKHILNMSDFLTEKKVVYKRQYTENYPAQRVSTAARVRNAVLDAMADGVLTEEELQGILRTANAGSRWLQRNGDLFKITEDETGRSYCLSNKGQRIMRATRAALNESVSKKKVDAGQIADKMLDIDRLAPFADKVRSMGKVSAFDLDQMLPDYIAGHMIYGLFDSK